MTDEERAIAQRRIALLEQQLHDARMEAERYIQRHRDAMKLVSHLRWQLGEIKGFHENMAEVLLRKP